ncbi:hypothetical protein C5Y96_17760 [Blastopirellula marina]|uniref:Uncharacterized protein n=1 Tax=Blastopirellula marina TaxID=124 RepID=A0A2S8F5G0_9BACT|nr:MULTISPECIES: hypothetical protein [Pirellulaceae]PQO27387.1 hypothetical protein C5Y96_17760 [Blastopirellula marina]RCS47924.1 hypothetical protein DTL36_17785 [Bremerella cremea]
MSYDRNEFFHPDGTAKTSAERQAYRDQRDLNRSRAKKAADEARQRDAAKASPYEKRIAELKAQKKYATPADREGINRRLAMLEPAQEKWEAEQSQAKWQADFDRSQSAQNAMTSIDLIKKSGRALYPGATQEQLDRLISMADVRHEYPDPDSFGSEFFSLLGEVEEAEIKRANQEASDKRLEANRLEAEATKAELQAAEAKQRRESLPGGGHE